MSMLRTGLLGSIFVAATLSAVAVAQYQPQITYLQNLRSPLNPTADQCTSMAAAFSRAQQVISEQHDRCLSGPGSDRSGGTCTKAACQGLHDLRDYAVQRAQYEAGVCQGRVRQAAIEKEQQLQEAQAAMARYEQQMESIRAIQAESRQSQPVQPSQQPSQATHPAPKPNRARSANGSDNTGWVETFINHPITQSVIENLKLSTGAAVAEGVQDVVPGLRAPAIGTLGGAATTVGGVATAVGVGALDPDVARGVGSILERRGGRHPADRIADDGSLRYPPPLRGDCTTLNDQKAKQELGQLDPSRVLYLERTCIAPR